MNTKTVALVMLAALAGLGNADCNGNTGTVAVATYDCKKHIPIISSTPYGYALTMHVVEMNTGWLDTTVTSVRSDGVTETLNCTNTSGYCSTVSWAWNTNADGVDMRSGLFATAQYVNPDTFNGQKYVVSCVKTEGVNLY